MEKINVPINSDEQTCPICNISSALETMLCPFCGAVIQYDDESDKYFTNSYICCQCGCENIVENGSCAKCRKARRIICPECERENELGDLKCRYCKTIFADIDELITKRETVIKKELLKTGRRYRFLGIIVLAIFASAFYLCSYFNADTISPDVGFRFNIAAIVLMTVAIIISIVAIVDHIKSLIFATRK
jgi:hypothetical protein